MTISGFVAYVKQVWKNKPDTSSPLSAERLNTIEGGIKGNSDAIEAIAAAVVNQIVNDPNKIASMAALYSVNSQVTQLNSDLVIVNSGIAVASSKWLDSGTSYNVRVSRGALRTLVGVVDSAGLFSIYPLYFDQMTTTLVTLAETMLNNARSQIVAAELSSDGYYRVKINSASFGRTVTVIFYDTAISVVGSYTATS